MRIVQDAKLLPRVRHLLPRGRRRLLLAARHVPLPCCVVLLLGGDDLIFC